MIRIHSRKLIITYSDFTSYISNRNNERIYEFTNCTHGSMHMYIYSLSKPYLFSQVSDLRAEGFKKDENGFCVANKV